MYKDIITYELADNITQEYLLKVAGQIVNDWMKDLPGFIKWEINLNNDSGYTDIVSWATKEYAHNATNEMANVPKSGEWYACYKQDSISSKNMETIADF